MTSRRPMCILALVVTLVAGAISAGCSAAPTERLRLVLGVNLELSGSGSQLGQAHRAALQLAVRNVQDSQGVSVRLIFHDNRSDADQARSITENFLHDDTVSAVLGGSAAVTATAMAAASAAAGTNKPVMLLAADAPTINAEQAQNVFAMTAGADVVADALLAGLRRRNIKRVAALGSKNDYGQAGVAELKAHAADFGITVADTPGFSPDGKDLEQPVRAATSDSANAVVVWSPRGIAATVAQHLHEARANAQLYFTPGADTQELAAEPVADGVSLVSSAIIAAGNTAATYPGALRQRQFLADYRLRLGVLAPELSASFDAVDLFVQAARDAHSVQSGRLREQLTELSFEGFNGTYEFTSTRHNGLARSSLVVATLHGGAWS